MDLSRTSQAERIAAAGAVLLLISLFFKWYGASVEAGGFSASTSVSAWEALSIIDILLFLLGLVVLALVLARAAGAVPPELPLPPAQILLGAGALAVLLVLFRIIDLPTPGDLPDGVDVSRKFGIFLALVSAAAIAYGGWRESQGPAGRVQAPGRV
jgi:hypothetical protein